MKLKFPVILLLIITIFSCTSIPKNVHGTLPKVAPKEVSFTPKDQSWKNLSLREKIGQTMVIRAFRDDQVKQYGSIQKMMKQYPVGGIYVPWWDFINKPPRDSVVFKVRSAVAEYENASKYPLIITEDYERGVGNVYSEFTHFPAEMSLGAANSKDLAYQFGNGISKEAASLGINWLLHPLGDLNMNPLQDLVVERAISDNAERAYPLLKAQIQGMNDQGTVATLKHFPGDGTTIKNQHLVTSSNTLSKKDWDKSFGALYQNMINDGVACIMVGHINFPAVQTKKLKGVFPPATLSEELMVDLLKGKMKFNGVIMSDALNMGGAAGYYKNELETAIEAFKAGVDLVLWPNLEYMDEVEKRILSGEIPSSRLDDAVERIWGVREKYGLIQKKNDIFYHLKPNEVTEIKNTAKGVANHAVTLVSGSDLIPLNPNKDKKILIVNISFEDKSNILKTTQKALNDYGFVADTILHNPNFFDYGQKLEYFDQYDKIIVAFENHYFSPLGTSLLKDKEALGLWTLGMLPAEKIIAVSYSNPYYVNLYFEKAPIKINAYSLDDFSQKAVIEALTGSIPFKGTTPVNLDQPMLK